MKTATGTLYLIPTTLGTTEITDVLPQKIREIILICNHFIVENEKTARHFIKKICPEKAQFQLQLFILDKHTSVQEFVDFLIPCLEGFPMGIISEAGCPAIADPGADIVALAHQKHIKVEPLVGPSSIILALMSSGLNGQNFAFNGYLPIDKNERRIILKKLERKARDENQTQLFIETPYRNNKLLQDMLRFLPNEMKICIATDITLSTEFIKTQKVSKWRNEKIELHKRPAIFVIGY